MPIRRTLAAVSLLASLLVPVFLFAAGPNIVANPSMETPNAAGTAPLNWLTDTWGTNTPTFQYKTDGHNSSRSAYVSITGYTDGDAKWYFQPVQATPGATYAFSEWYKSNVPTHIVWMSTNASGVDSYNDVLVTVPASATSWSQVTANIKIPTGSKTFSVLHLLEGNGWLQTDDFSFANTTATTTAVQPTITSFSANPLSITQGSSTTLSWVVSNASSTSIDQGVGVVTGTSKIVSPSATTTYTLTATNPAGSVTRSVVVGVVPQVTTPQGSVVVSTDSSSPSYQVVAANQTEVVMGAFKFRPSNENQTLRHIGLKLSNVASSSSSDLVQVTLWVGATQIGKAVFTGNNKNATSTNVSGSGDMNYALPVNIDTVVTVKADIAPIGTNQPVVSGHLVAIDVDTNGSNTQTVGVSSGLAINATGSTHVAGIRIFKSIPMFTYTTAGSALNNGVNDLLVLSVTADAKGEIQLNKLTFILGMTTATLSAPTFTGPSGNVSSTTNVKFDPVSNHITVYFDSLSNTADPVINAGQTKTFTLRGTVSGLTGSNSGSVSVALKADPSLPSLGASAFMGTTDQIATSKIIWSPGSTTTAVTADNDWTNGYGLAGCFSSRGLGNDCAPRILTHTATTPSPTVPTINSFTANPLSITQGSSTTLLWNISNASTTSINHGVGIVTGTTKTVSPTATTTYTITAVNPVGTTTATVTVGVTLKPATSTPAVNLVSNSSAESGTTAPTGWIKDRWGTNTTVFSYLTNSGHTGTHSVKVEMTAYKSGDAKWAPPAIPVTPGESYDYSDWYQSNVITWPVVEFENTDGTFYYLGLRPLDPSASWKQFDESFQVPAGAKSMRLFHVLQNVGYLTIDDVSVSKFTPKGFDKARVTLSFDDGWEDDTMTVLPVLKDYGFHMSFFFATEFLESSPATGPINVSGASAIKAMQADGHEIGDHSVTHPDLTTLSPTKLDYELRHSKEYLESVAGVGSVKNLATPFGSYNNAVIAKAKTLYESLRSTDEGFNTVENFDPYRLTVQNMQKDTTLAQYQSWVDQAKKDKSWLILVYHRVATSTLDQFDTPIASLRPQMDILKNSGVAVRTMNQALHEVLPQVGL